MRNRLIAATMISIGVACAPENATTPLATKVAEKPQFAAGSKRGDSRANIVFSDSVNVAAPGSAPVWTAAGIRGDGRLKAGTAASGNPSNEYQGDFCGVYGMLGATAVLNIEPEINWTSTMQARCGGYRYFNYYLAGLDGAPTQLTPHSLVDTLAVIPVGGTSTRLVRMGVHMPNCDGLRFDDAFPPANDARVTRLPDIATPNGLARQWVIESRGSHLASCVVAGKAGRFSSTGVTYYLPFSIKVTEVPYPAPTYP